jgi:hypothetical protein
MFVERDSQIRTANRPCQHSLAMLSRQPAQILTVGLERSNAHSTAMPEVTAKTEHRKPSLAARDRLTFNSA